MKKERKLWLVLTTFQVCSWISRRWFSLSLIAIVTGVIIGRMFELPYFGGLIGMMTGLIVLSGISFVGNYFNPKPSELEVREMTEFEATMNNPWVYYIGILVVAIVECTIALLLIDGYSKWILAITTFIVLVAFLKRKAATRVFSNLKDWIDKNKRE